MEESFISLGQYLVCKDVSRRYVCNVSPACMNINRHDTGRQHDALTTQKFHFQFVSAQVYTRGGGPLGSSKRHLKVIGSSKQNDVTVQLQLETSSGHPQGHYFVGARVSSVYNALISIFVGIGGCFRVCI